jgi:dienelactone hydrolase
MLTTLRLDHRDDKIELCARDVLVAIDFLKHALQIRSFVLVGFAFGAEAAFSVAADSEVAAVVSLACLASYAN